jgi:diguanylate cyclase (GGDEF)-like protein
MRDPNDARDIIPRIGSPLWTYITAVTAAGVVTLGVAAAALPGSGVGSLLRQPLLWVIVVLALVGELRPIITPGKSGTDSGDASLTFCFAALLYWGFPVAAIVRVVISLAGAVIGRTALFRSAFNAAQYTLSMAAAWLVLAVAGIHPRPLVPWLPDGSQLLAVALAGGAYFLVNYALVGVAVALHTRSPLLATFRKELAYQAFVSLVLLSAAPLVVVVMGRSVLLVLLFLLPLTAIYVNAAMSLQREHQAYHDDLTGLPNRTFLLRKTAQALREAARTRARAGFLLLDLDRFKEVNDTLGHAVGDSLLRLIAHRLAHSVRPGDMVARLGGDEFAVLLPAVRSAAAAREVASRLRAALAVPVHLEGMSFEVEASVGIALYPDDATGVELLLQRADVAMYLAKERHTGVEAYASDADRNSAVRLSLLGDLRRGMDHGELELYYQPKVSLTTGRTSGLEAVIRWQHPARGLISAGEFVPAVEQTYLMRDLTAYVAETAAAQAARWRRAGIGVPVAIKLSARDLLDTGLAGMIETSAGRQGLTPGDLMLEVSERVLAGQPAQATMALEALAATGFPVGLGGFGTGYSSLVKLGHLPVSEIKIDGALVAGLLDGAGNEVIVKSLVELVRALGISCVADGVETAEVASALAVMGCEAVQGSYVSEPLSPAAATDWLTARRRVLAAGEPVPHPAPPLHISQPRMQRAAPSKGGHPAGHAAHTPAPPAEAPATSGRG